MTDEVKSDVRSSSFNRVAVKPVADGRTTGGSGVQRSHLRDRKAWLKRRSRAGKSWAQRKAMSNTYCPARVNRT